MFFQERDNGPWRCSVGTVVDSQVITANADTQLYITRGSLGGSQVISCKAFSGESGDKEVFVDDSGLFNITQTFTYIPDNTDNKKALRCVVYQVDDVSAGVSIQIAQPKVESQSLATAGVVVIVVIVVLVVVFVGVVFGLYWSSLYDGGEVTEDFNTK